MASKKIQLYTDRDKTIEASPETSANCVILSDGNDLQKVLDNDLTTPTVVHEETNFKVGVGDVNVSSSVVDGEVGRMVIKGKTYQNILPEPSLRNSMTNGKSMQKLNEGYENVSVVDGVAKSAILKGVTGYKDVDTGEILETFEEGRNLELVSVKMPVLSTIGKNLFISEKMIIGDGNLYGYYKFKDNENIKYTLSISDKDTSVDVSGIYLGMSKLGINASGGYNWVLNSGSIANTNTMSITTNFNYVSIYPNNIATLNKLTQRFKIQLEEGTVTTPYEPYKSNILTVDEEVELRGIGDVQDTLDLNTGKLTSYYGERIITEEDSFSTTLLDGKCTCIVKVTDKISSYTTDNFLADKIPSGTPTDTDFGIYPNLANFVIYETGDDLDAFKAKVIGTKLYYQLAEKVHKTVDLSSFGNWEKVVLDGSDDEGWGKTESTNSNTKSLWFMPNTEQLKGGAIFCDKLPTTTSGDSIGVRNSKSGGIYIHIDKTETLGVREWVAKNSPLTIWYQTTTSQANSIKEMLSFSNGHIQLSSEEGSLIPSLDYEVPTSNSYHMDLMKEGTYTMKCESCNGSLNFLTQNLRMLGTNKTFEVQSVILREDKLVMLEGSWTNPMIIEGDVTSVTLPYFTGIKSSFEGESKIEVLSTGKNLFDRKLSEYDYIGNYDKNEVIIGDNFIEWNASNSYKGAAYYHFYVKPNTSYTLSLERNIMQRNCITIYDGFVTSNMDSISNMEANKNNTSFVTLSNKITIRFSNGTILNETFKIYNVQLEEGDTVTTYEPYKSNSTKIPLLSPLRSLPNGACDELIIDRMKKKATLIQRVGKAMFDGSDNEIWGFMDSPSDTTSYLYQCYVRDAKANSNDASEHLLCKNILVRTANSNWNNKYESGIALNENKNIQLRCTKDESSFRSWLSKNPTTVYYQLETPVVTEIDLEGFPLVYKDGHIFLNSEIAPVVEIAYNVNQTQQIQANNETLQRHELDILDLDNLIVSFVNAEYNLRLLKFDMELSMMALAE